MRELFQELYGKQQEAPPGESFEDWLVRTDKAMRKHEERMKRRAKAKKKAREKRKRTGR